jgi:predicted ester cyclase
VAADGVVEGYLEAVATQDWERLRAAVTDDVVREGPFGDVYTGVDGYVEFLSGLMPTLRGYAMDVARVTYVDDGRRAFAELSETVELDGAATVTPEVLVFDLNSDGLIGRIAIYTRRS